MKKNIHGVTIEFEFLPFLSDDVTVLILQLLSSSDLHTVAQINSSAYCLASTVQIQRYRRIFARSLLWRYLPVIAQDLSAAAGEHFIDYFEISANVTVAPDKRNLYQSLSSFWTTIRRVYQVPNNWNGHEINDWTSIQAIAQNITRKLPLSLVQLPVNLHLFLELCSPSYSLQQQLELFQRYHTLESLMSTLMLFLRISSMKRYNQAQLGQQFDLVGTLIDPLLNRWLTGATLITFDNCLSDILSILIREALRIHLRDQEQETPDQKIVAEQRLQDIENLLERLTESDLLTYLSPEDYRVQQVMPVDPIDRQAYFNPRFPDRKRRLFIDAIDANYVFLMRKMSQALLFRIERSDSRFHSLAELRVIPRILQSAVLLTQLDDAGIVKILSTIHRDEKCFAMRTHPALYSFLTFEILEQWILSEEFCRHLYSKLILTQKELLGKLSDDQIIKLAKYLRSENIFELLTDTVFINRIKIKKDYSHLLLQLCCLSEPLLPYDIEIFDHIALHHLNRFSTHDFIEFTQQYFLRPANDSRVNVLLRRLPEELDVRSGSFTSAQWLAFGCLHPDIGLIIANKYLRRLSNSDCEKLMAKYRDNNQINQKIRDALGFYDQVSHRQLVLPDRQDIQRISEYTEYMIESLRASNQLHIFDGEESARMFLAQSAIQDSQCQPPAKKFDWLAFFIWVALGIMGIIGIFGAAIGIIQGMGLALSAVIITPIILSMVKNDSRPRVYNWKTNLVLGLLIALGIIGICLTFIGMASGFGIPIAITITSTLLPFLPLSGPLVSALAGFVLYMISTFFNWLIRENAPKKPAVSLETTVHSLAMMRFIIDSPGSSSSLQNNHSQLSARPSFFQPVQTRNLRVRHEPLIDQGSEPCIASINF